MVTLLKWTVPDYHHLIEQGLLDGKKVELLDGNLVTMAPEEPLHSYTTNTVADYLRQNLHGIALVREAHPITLSQSEPEPDIAIVLPSQERYREKHPQAEDIFWLMEIAHSTQAYDLNDKKQIYAQEGIPEYWVADLTNRQLFVFRAPDNGDYRLQQTYSDGIICSQAFPDIKISVQEMLHW
ncbi:Uma2 family endonuclease [Synechocystis salina LEGE 06099]|uniref:Uma2 family endonuclease n=1 Tax=Synechocystis salina TaxID=945780 RepID=UPI001882BB59|nr:Uma2 family endonuclease [Synechocystis salina]MBE9204434.1 Uma2 family endonuclease [Synechocystis salina LEGE 06099]